MLTGSVAAAEQRCSCDTRAGSRRASRIAHTYAHAERNETENGTGTGRKTDWSLARDRIVRYLSVCVPVSRRVETLGDYKECRGTVLFLPRLSIP